VALTPIGHGDLLLVDRCNEFEFVRQVAEQENEQEALDAQEQRIEAENECSVSSSIDLLLVRRRAPCTMNGQRIEPADERRSRTSEDDGCRRID
jgi:hypothetical protein